MNKTLLKTMLVTALCLLCSISASAYDFASGGLYYNITSTTDLTVEVTYKSYTNYKYSNDAKGAVAIPSSVSYFGKNYSVSSLGAYAFLGCTDLTSVSISNGVTSIGNSAFSGCTGMKSATIGNSVTTIGVYAFEKCSSLTSINIPNSVTSIGHGAFRGTAWDNNLPDGLVYAGLVAYKYKGTMPENTSIEIKDGTKGIASDAFDNCTGLTSVTIPNSVTSIGSSAFACCSGLTSVTIPSSVTSIGYSAFYSCTKLATVNYNATNCTTIETPFSGCTSLATLNIGDNVKAIPNFIFSGCTGLTSINIPNSVTSIGINAFWETAWDDNLPDGLVYAGLVAYKYKGTMPENTSIEIKDGTKGIGGGAFSGCTGLTSVTIPNSVTSIGESAFYRCTGLTSVTIPNSVTSIGGSAFSGCTGMKSATIGNSVTTIGAGAFYSCTKLATVNYNATNCTINYNATNSIEAPFSGCTSLATLNIGDNVKAIPNFIFSGCTGLTSVTIPNSVTSIGNSAFSGCTGLTSVSIGNSVTAIGESAFCDCTGLTTKCYVPFSVTSIGTDAFKGTNDMFVLFQATPTLINATQTTLKVGLTTNIADFDGADFDHSITDTKITCNGTELSGTEVTFTGLAPIRTYPISFIVTVGGSKRSYSASYTTNKPTPSATKQTVGQTYAVIRCITGLDGVTDAFKEYGIEFDGKKYPISSGDTYKATGLQPNSSHNYRAYVKGEIFYYYSSTSAINFTTKALTVASESPTSISNTTATINGTVDCDTEGGALFGFEWRDAAASSMVESSVCYSQNINGYIANGLANLSPLREYHYRAFVKVGDTFYYGNWKGLFTSNAYAFWAPSLYTFGANQDDATVMLSGYYVPGSDAVVSKGFRVWTSTSNAPSRATAIDKLYTAGNDMTVSINKEEIGTGEFNFATFVTTSTGDTYYGETQKFTIETSGIEDAATADGNAVKIWAADRRITVAGAENRTITVYTLQGIAIKSIPSAESREEIEMADGGIYIVRVDGNSTKVMVK